MKMIKSIKWLLLMAFLPMFASCSWEPLPSYEDANIEGVEFYHRYLSPTDTDPITGEPMVRNGNLTKSNVEIDTEAGTVTLTLRATRSNYPTEVFEALDLNNVVGTVTLSTAARIAPTDNHKVLGVPDDWTSPHSFVVTAANGTKKTWTITVTELRK